MQQRHKSAQRTLLLAVMLLASSLLACAGVTAFTPEGRQADGQTWSPEPQQQASKKAPKKQRSARSDRARHGNAE